MNMRTDNDLDSLFKKKFGEFSSEIPSESFLEDLDRRLAHKSTEKRFGYWKWYLSSLLLFISLVGWSTWYYYSAEKVKIQPKHEQTEYTNEKSKSPNNKVDNLPVSKIFLKNNSILKRPNRNVSKVLNPIDDKKGAITVEKDVYTDNPNLTFNDIQQNVLKIPLEQEKIIDTIKVLISKELVDSTKKEETNITTKNSKKNLQQKKKWNFSAAVLNGVSQIYSSKGTPSLSAAQQAVFTSNYTEDDLKNVIRNRNAIESSLTSWDLSIRLEATRSNMVLSSGLDFIRLGERITFDDTAGLQQMNSYSYVNLPLNFGWKFALKKFQIKPFVGTAFGFSVGNSIGNYIISNNLSSNYMVSNNQSASFVVLGQLGCMLEYVSISGFKVMISPMLRSSVSNVVHDGLIKTRYSTFGLQLGVGYQW
jgi:hypothetical protein